MYFGGPPKPNLFASQQDFEEIADKWWIDERQRIADKLDLLVGIPDVDEAQLTAAQWLQRRELLLEIRERCVTQGFLVEINELFLDPDFAPFLIQSAICEALGWEYICQSGKESYGARWFALPPSGLSRERALLTRLSTASTPPNADRPSQMHGSSRPNASRVDVCILDPNGIYRTAWTIGKEISIDVFQKAYDAEAECLYAITTYDSGIPHTFVTTRKKWLQAKAVFGRIDPSEA